MLLIVSGLLKQRHVAITNAILLVSTVSYFTACLGTVWQGHTPVQSKSLSVLSVNVLSKNSDYQAFLSLVEAQQPDVIVALEVSPEWAESFHVFDAQYPYKLIKASTDNFGIAVLSRKPFEGRVYNLSNREIPYIEADFDGWVLYAAHPMPPHTALTDIDLKIYLEHITEKAARHKSALVAGDLNTTLWSRNFQPLRSAGFKTSNPVGIAWTWPVFFPLFAIQIDHILTKGMDINDFEVLGPIGSDHFPVMAKISLK